MKRSLIPLLIPLLLAACAPRTAAQTPQHSYRAEPSEVVAVIRSACPLAPTDPFYDAWRLSSQQAGQQTCFSGPSLTVGPVDQSSIQAMTFTVTQSGAVSSVTVQLINNASGRASNAVFRSLDAKLPRP